MTQVVELVATDRPENGFTAFYREQAPLVFQLATRLGCDAHSASDCVDEVFTRLARSWQFVEQPAVFVRRATVNHLQRQRRRYTPRSQCRPADPPRRIEHHLW